MTERIEKLLQFLEESPNDAFLNHALALEYIKLGNDTAAQAHFNINLNTSPDYVATYYHLAKLQERGGNITAAIATSEQGMAYAKAAKDMHSYNELQNLYEDLAY